MQKISYDLLMPVPQVKDVKLVNIFIVRTCVHVIVVLTHILAQCHAFLV